MNFTPQNNKRLRKDYLKMASERLRTAKAALDLGNLRDSISRSYYAFLDSASAILITRDIIPQSHKGAIRLFSLHFIKTGLVDEKYAKWFKRIEKERIEADYKPMREFTLEEAKEALEEAEEFVDMTKKLIPKIAR